MSHRIRNLAIGIAAGLAALTTTFPASAQELTLPSGQEATYVDLVTLAERSDLVLRLEIRRQTEVKRERAPGLAPGFARLYIEATTLALISGSVPVGENLTFLLDVPLNQKGKPPKLKKQQLTVFAREVPNRPGSIQLTGANAHFLYTPPFEARLRPILRSLVAADQPPIITGISDALAVEGTLTGESETQIFLETEDQSPVSITVLRRPGQRPAWGVSWGEIIDSSARAPQPESLEWFRMACALPASLPSNANLARDPSARRLAAADYAYVIESLGPCERNLTRE